MLLTIVFALIGLAATVLVCLIPGVSNWWALLLWPTFDIAAGTVYTITIISLILLVPAKPLPPLFQRIQNWFVRQTVAWAMVVFGIHCRLIGSEKLPQDQPFLFVANHRCAFDPFAMLATYKPGSIRFIAKEEIFKVPIVGGVMKHLFFLFVDRHHPRNAVASIRKASEQITQQNLSIGIFPEGSRSKTEDLLPFHAGSFKIAKMAACPVAVASVRVKPRKHLTPSRIEIRVLGQIDQEVVAQSKTNELAEIAAQMIREDLGLQ